jgi:hypothetical protein
MRETVETTAGMTEILFRESKGPHALARSIINAMKAFVRNDPLFSSIFFESWGLIFSILIIFRYCNYISTSLKLFL